MRERNVWHSVTGRVYHDSDHCSAGHSIKVSAAVTGRGGRPLCSECAALAERGVPRIMKDWDKTADGRVHSIAI